MNVSIKSTLPSHQLNAQDESVYKTFRETIDSPDFGFFHVTNRSDLLEKTQAVWKKFTQKKYFVHVGIGGSSLGPEMMISALKKNNDVTFIFLNNIDPDDLSDKLSAIPLQECLFYFVSKSGGTAETMATLAIVANLLTKEGIEKTSWRDYFVFATDPTKSDLLQLGKELNIDCLEVPTNVGGRFTALTPVGYLPCLAAGIDIQLLAKGAEAIKKDLLNENFDQNILRQLGAYLSQLLSQQGISQTVFMPYSSKLRDLSFWFTQLWAESLGKKLDLNGKVVHRGMTPIPAYGATDQHSQMQLFMEGPKDKCLLLLEVESFENDFSLTNSIDLPAFKKLAPYSLQQLMKAELYGTIKALQEAKRPFIHLAVSKNDEQAMGGLILLFESLTVLMGSYLEVNPFDQPGVEAGKIFAYEFLNQR